jgi:uncharacterized repeat protein (TIGR01451 family)
MATQYINQATANVTVDGQEINFASNSVTSELFDETSVTLVKTQSSDLVVSGGTITYTVIITNLSLAALTDFNFLDTIPTGMTYINGSFEVNGTPETPNITGQDLSYQFTTLPIGVTTVTFDCDVT